MTNKQSTFELEIIKGKNGVKYYRASFINEKGEETFYATNNIQRDNTEKKIDASLALMIMALEDSIKNDDS